MAGVSDHTARPLTMFSPSEHSDMQIRLRQLPFLGKELLAGGAAGGLAKTCVAPLERVKILFQTGRVQTTSISGTLTQIYSSEGLSGLFRGNGASVLRIIPYSAFHFGAYERYRSALIHMAGYDTPPPAPKSAGHPHHTDPDHHPVAPPPAAHHSVPPVLDLLAGSAAGATAVMLTYPLDFARTKLAYEVRDANASPGTSHANPTSSNGHPQTKTSTAASHLQHHQEALRRSSHASASSSPRLMQAESLTHKASQHASPLGLGAYDRHAAHNSAAHRQLRHMVASASSAPSPAAPQAAIAAPPHSSIHGILGHTLKQEGFKGIYRGIGPTLAGILPYAGLKFYVYQSLKQQYRSTEGHSAQRLPILVMLSFGAGAGLVAQTATYPLDVVRRQMQVQGPHGQSALAKQHIPSTLQGLVMLWRNGGRRSLFRGLSLNYIKVVPSTAIGFAIYDALKQYLALPQNL